MNKKNLNKKLFLLLIFSLTPTLLVNVSASGFAIEQYKLVLKLGSEGSMDGQFSTLLVLIGERS